MIFVLNKSFSANSFTHVVEIVSKLRVWVSFFLDKFDSLAYIGTILDRDIARKENFTAENSINRTLYIDFLLGFSVRKY